MDTSSFFAAVTFLAAAAAGCVATWLVLAGKLRGARLASATLTARLEERDATLGSLESELTQRRAEEARLREGRGRLEAELAAEQRASEVKLAVFGDAEHKLREAFEALSAEALRRNNQSFLELARESMERFQKGAQDDLGGRHKAIGALVEPVQKSLVQMESVMRDMEKERASAYESLREQVRSMTAAQERLRTETAGLAQALKSPSARGRWGEIQLKRVVELAGMEEHCDFAEQQSLTAGERTWRPDLIINLPGHKHLVVDAKTPLQAYLEAAEAEDDDRRQAKLDEHARQVKAHVNELGSKAYWERFEATPDFVVLFLPGEAFFAEAARRDPGLLEFAMERRVLLTSPSTLVALLKAAHYGWQQEKIGASAQLVRELGAELYERLSILTRHFVELGSQIDRTVETYDGVVGSFERRVVASARRLKELGAGTSRELDTPKTVGRTVRRVALPDPAAEDPGPEEGHA